MALNIMKIRRRLGDNWDLSWEDYKTERLKDGRFSDKEQGYFEKVMEFIPGPAAAMRFCPGWRENR